MEKVLVIQSAFIGDAILVSSMLEEIHKAKPKAEIHLLVRKGNEGLYASHPFLQKVWVWNKKEKYKSLFSILKEVRAIKFDWLFCVQRFGTMGFFTAFSKAKNKVGFKKNPWSAFFNFKIDHQIGNGLHEIERNRNLLTPWISLPEKAYPPKLYLNAACIERAGTYGKSTPYVCLFPASVWFTKQAPREKWIELIHKYKSTHTIYMMGAPGDKDYCDQIIADSGANSVENLCGKLSLTESAALMKTAAMNYVNDSAPLHLASATNAPVTAFFCSTIPDFGFGPLSESSTIIEVEKPLECRPCGLHGKKDCPLGHFKCGHDLQI